MLDVVSGVGSGLDGGADGSGLMESLGGNESSPSAEDILGEWICLQGGFWSILSLLPTT